MGSTAYRSVTRIPMALLACICAAIIAGCGGGSGSDNGDDNGNGGKNGSAEGPEVSRYAYVLHGDEPSVSWYRIDTDQERAVSGGYLFLGEYGGEETDDIAITPDGRFIYVSDPAGSQVHILAADADTGRLTHAGVEDFDNTITAPGAMAMAPDGEVVYIARAHTGSGDNIRAYAIDPDDGSLSAGTTPVPVNLDNLPTTLALSPDGDHLFAGSSPGDNVQVFTVDGTGPVQKIDTAAHSVDLDDPQVVAVTPDGDRLFVGSDGAGLFAFEINEDGGLDRIDANGSGRFGDISFSPDGERIFASQPDPLNATTSIFILDEDTRQLEFDGNLQSSGDLLFDINFTSFDPTGQYLLAGSSGSSEGESILIDSIDGVDSSDYRVERAAMSRTDPIRAVWSAGEPTRETGEHLYLADSSDSSNVIERFTLDVDGRPIDRKNLTEEITTVPNGIRGLAVLPGVDILFSAHEQGAGSVWAWEIDRDDGTFTGTRDFETSAPGSTDLDPVDLAVDPSLRFVYAANIDDEDVGRISLYRFDAEDFSLSQPDSGAIAVGDWSPKAIVIEPSGRFLYVARDDGVLETFAIDPETGELDSFRTITLGNPDDPPTHLEIPRDGRGLVYADSFLSPLEIFRDGTPLSGQSFSGPTVGEGPTALALRPDGSTVYHITPLTGQFPDNHALTTATVNQSFSSLDELDLTTVRENQGDEASVAIVNPEGTALIATFSDVIKHFELDPDDGRPVNAPGEEMDATSSGFSTHAVIRSRIE